LTLINFQNLMFVSETLDVFSGGDMAWNKLLYNKN